MVNAPVTTMERLEWLAQHCDIFSFAMDKTSYMIRARKGAGRYYESAGPVELAAEAVDECLYEILPQL